MLACSAFCFLRVVHLWRDRWTAQSGPLSQVDRPEWTTLKGLGTRVLYLLSVWVSASQPALLDRHSYAAGSVLRVLPQTHQLNRERTTKISPASVQWRKELSWHLADVLGKNPLLLGNCARALQACVSAEQWPGPEARGGLAAPFSASAGASMKREERRG